MRFIFAEHDRNRQIRLIKESIAEHRIAGTDDPKNFRMHSLYDRLLEQMGDHLVPNWADEIAIVGQGGYGRTEMSPYSDIDLLFLCPDNAPEGIFSGIRSILYLLWDAAVELGHSVRTVDQCEEEAINDLAVLTSLMDTRLIWGDHRIYRKLEESREALISRTDPLELYLRIQGEINKSCEMHGDTIYLLEPNLKEGPGSLRYIQLIMWLSRMVFGYSGIEDLHDAGACDRAEVDQVKEGVSFLAEIRTRLHLLSGRRDDRLSFQAQPVIAKEMGFVDPAERISAASFMREYYRHAATMDFFGRRLLARTRLSLRPDRGVREKRLKLEGRFYVEAGGINYEAPEEFGKDPMDLLNAFLHVARTGCDPDIRLVDLLQANLGVVDGAFMVDPQANSLFVHILRSSQSVYKALNAMMKIGFLERFIREFAWVRFLPSFDAIHQYTVDLHTMKVLEYIDVFRRATGPSTDLLLRTICSRLDKVELLYLAGLFHDIGKGRGSGHEVRGEQITRQILVRLGLPREDVEDVCFLIRNHLAMTQIAFKKDLHDAAAVHRFAENVIHRRRLDLLFLLTHADLRATGPTAFNSWRQMLLEELYYRTLDVLEGVDEAEDLAGWLKEIREVVRKLVPDEYRGPELDEFLNEASSRYLLDFYPALIVEHYVTIRSFLEAHGKSVLEPVDVIVSKVDHHYEPGYSSITLITSERRGLFFRIAGVMSAGRINILGAWTHTIGDNIVIATFHVNDIPEGPLDDPIRWEKFNGDIREVLRGRLDVEELVASKRASTRFRHRRPRHAVPVQIEIDNAASDRATIIEVSAQDRPGLLYDITRHIYSQGLNIILTKITTQVDQATDVFYVTDESGRKILDFGRLDQIRASLRDNLKEMEKDLQDDQTSITS